MSNIIVWMKSSTKAKTKTLSILPTGPTIAPTVSRRRSEFVVKTDALDQSISYLLRRAQLSTFQAFLSTMKSYDVRPINYAVLVMIRANPGLSQIALASTLGIRKANFVMVLDGLVDRGLAERRRDPEDRRAAALYLTQPGKTFVRRLEVAHLKLEKTIQKRLGALKTDVLLKLLREFCATSEIVE